MANKKRIKIKSKANYCKAAKKISRYRLKIILERIEMYMQNPSVETLHKLRISFRRLRYVFELFESCYEREVFLYVLTYLKRMQDIIGSSRDLDVIKTKIINICEENNLALPGDVLKYLNEDNTKFKLKISEELVKFKDDKIIQSLLKKSKGIVS